MKKKIYESPESSEYCMGLNALLCVSDWEGNIEAMGETDFIM